MAKNNKTIESPYHDADDDPTAELKALTQVAGQTAQAPLENDEHTCSFDDDDAGDARPVHSLRADLQAKKDSISQLQFDIEQLRARWTGLEKEIKVREKLTDDLNDELRRIRNTLADRDQQVGSLETELDALRDQLTAGDETLAATRDELATVVEQADASTARVDVLEMQTAADRATLRLKDEELVQLRRDLKKQQKRAASPARELEKLKVVLHDRVAELDDLRLYVDARKDDWQAREDELRARNQELEQQARRLTDLSIKLDTTEDALAQARARVEPEKATPPPAPVRLSATRDAEIRDMQAQILRIENYADTLRQRLQDNQRDSYARIEDHARLQEALEAARSQATELAAQMDDLRLGKNDLETRHVDLEQRYDNDITELRDAVLAARTALDEQQGQNDDLNVAVTEHEQARQAAETRAEELVAELHATRGAHDARVSELEQQVVELERQLAENTASMADLMEELVRKSRTDDSINELGDAINDLGDRMQASFDDNLDRERCTRLLMGTVDGQELRFPLFKDRLTVGRSRDNDIQLKTQCVSRRHALITCDNKRCRLTDQNSKNGIYVNDVAVTEAELKNGDRIVIGTASLVFEERARR